MTLRQAKKICKRTFLEHPRMWYREGTHRQMEARMWKYFKKYDIKGYPFLKMKKLAPFYIG